LKFPKGFLESLPLPESELSEFQNALEREAKWSIRINPGKSKLAVPLEQVPWCTHGYYLDKRPRYTSNPSFHAGAFYPQEASSMFVSHILKQTDMDEHPIRALDLCAAPGGKTTLLQSELHPNALIHANETIQSRYQILIENTLKWGVPNVCTTNNDPADFKHLQDFYDLILVDAPCSGEGLFRKQSNASSHWSQKAVEHCSSRQKRILSDIWPSLKHNGFLIYSTCTYNRIENEENLKWLKGQQEVEFVDIDVSSMEGIVKNEENGIKGYRFFPHKIEGEGFFCSVIRKTSGKAKSKFKSRKKTYRVIGESNEYSLLENGLNVYAVQATQMANLQILENHFQKKFNPGLEVGKMLGSSVKYSQGMALLCNSPTKTPTAVLSLVNSLHYLKKEDVQLKLNKGRYLIKFEGFNLGFAKSDQRRLISQYPKNWRILKASAEEYIEIVESLK